MKILLWAPFGAGTHYWGPGTSAYRLYKNNKLKDVEVTLVHSAEEQDLFPEVYKEQIKLPAFRNGTYLDMIMYFIVARKWIKKNHHKFDVVHGISAFEYTFRPMIKFTTYGVPVFIKLTGESGGFGNNSKLSRLLGIAGSRKKNANTITGYISISSHVTKNLLEHGISKGKIFEITNGVNDQRFVPLSLKEKNELRNIMKINNILTFIYVGGLTFNKRVIEIVKAISELNAEGITGFQFLMVGPDRSGGLVEKEIEILINIHKLKEIIIRVNHTDFPEKYMQMGDVFMLVSGTEGMSNALLEAMSCGLAVIVTPISGSVDLIEDGYNGLYCDGTVGDIKKQIIRYIEDKSLIRKFGIINREKIEKNFSDRIIFNKHINLFKKHVEK